LVDKQTFISVYLRRIGSVGASKLPNDTYARSLINELEYLPKTLTDRACMCAGREVIIGPAATVLLAPIERVQMIVTDTAAPAEFLQTIQECGNQVIRA
jgi:hypothetical protein